MADSKNCINLQIKVYPEEKARFLKLKDEMDEVIKTDRDAFLSLMDFYENPKTIKVDNPELIKRNQELAEEIVRLKQQLEELTNTGNDNAVAAQRLQLELDKANETIAARANRPENVFEVEVHPVPFYFLRKMAEYLSKEKKTEITPGYILTDLFLKDLQNPRSNNLPYVVSTSEIEKVLNAYKKEHPEEYEKS